MRELPRGARRFESGLPRGPDLFRVTGEAIGGRDVADRTV